MTHVVQKIAQITAEIGPLAKKKHAGDTVNYEYRKIDDVIDVLSPLMAKAGLVPRVEVVEHHERVIEGEKDQYSKALNTTIRAVVKSTYATVLVRLIVTDGETDICTHELGSSEDRGDKAQIQATSMAYKYAMMRLFNIPFSDKNTDTDGRYSERYAEDMEAERLAEESRKSAAQEQKVIKEKRDALIKRLKEAIKLLFNGPKPGSTPEKLFTQVNTFFKTEYYPEMLSKDKTLEDAHKAFWTGPVKSQEGKSVADAYPEYAYDFEMGLKRKEVTNG